MGDDPRLLDVVNVDDEEAVPGVGDDAVIPGDAGGPHVVRDVIGGRELDAGDEGRLFGIGDIEDFESVPFAVIAAPPRMVSGGGEAIVATEAAAITIPV